MDRLTFAKLLNANYLQRKNRNPRYSIRAFSRDLGISSGRINNYLNGSEIPAEKNLERMISALKLTSKKATALKKAAQTSRYLNRGLGFSKALNEQEFSQISSWQTWSILTLFQSSDFQPTTEWISKKMDFSISQVEKSLQQLEHAGLICKKSPFYELTCKNVTTTNDIPSQSIRQFHKQFIKLAENSLDQIPVEQRDISSITMCVNPEKVAQVKELIWEFRSRVNSLMEDSTNNNQIYQLNIQLFPISQNLESKK